MDQIDGEPLSCVNFVLLGKTGSGKSATGNTILGRKAFISKKSPTSVTQDVQIEQRTFQNFRVTVCDTPGFFDTELSDEQIREKCQSVFNKCELGHCVFLLVIKADRFTAEERTAVQKIEKLLGQNRLEKTWILFTKGDELEEENMTIKEFINETSELKKLVKKYQDRYHVFNNKKKKITSQVRCLLKKIFKGSNPFRDKLKRIRQTKDGTNSVSDRRLMLLGKCGVGKSASGNTILRRLCFRAERAMQAVTKKSKRKTECVAGRKVSVVDTPGLFDTDMAEDKLLTEMMNCMYLSSPGPHAFLIVLPVTSRFTAQEQEVIQQIKMIFGEEVTKYAILLFTNGDQLKGKNIEKLIEESQALRELVQQCGGYHIFNNEDQRNTQQVTELLEKIDKMVEQNGGSYYSNELFEEAARYRKEEMTKEEERKGKEKQEEILKEELKEDQRKEEQWNENQDGKEPKMKIQNNSVSKQMDMAGGEGQSDETPDGKEPTGFSKFCNACLKMINWLLSFFFSLRDGRQENEQ